MMSQTREEVRLDFRLACHSDDRALLGLLHSCYPHLRFSAAWWKWFSSERHDAQNQTYLAENDAEIIGCLSFIPITICSTSDLVAASVCVNIALHPRFRRSAGNPAPGIFARLLDYSLNQRRHNAESIQLSVPNVYSRNTLLRSGWRIVSPLRIFEKRRCSAQAINWAEVQVLDEDYDRLNAEVSRKLNFGVWKSSEYLRWRLLARPETRYHVFAIKQRAKWLGCVVLKRFFDEAKGERKVHVMQMLATNDDIADQLLQGVESFAANDHLVNVWVMDGDVYEPVLRRRKFQEQESRPLVGIADKPERWRVPQKCNFSFADIDVY